MKKLESLQDELFQKELTKDQLKAIKGSRMSLDTGTRATSTYAQNGQYCGQDCADNDGID